MLKQHSRLFAALLLAGAPLLASARGADTHIEHFVVAGGVAWFNAVSPPQLCRTDGTAGGTLCYRLSISHYEPPVAIGDKVYVLVYEGWGRAIYVADASHPPVKLADLRGNWNVSQLGTNGISLFSLAYREIPDCVHLLSIDVESGQVTEREILRTDSASVLSRAGDSLLLRIHDTRRWMPWPGKYDLWRVGESPATSALVLPDMDRYPTTPLGRVSLLQTSDRLWRTDGRATGTFLIGDGRLSSIIVGDDGHATFATLKEVWRTDGTQTTRLATLPFAPSAAALVETRLVVLERQTAHWAFWFVYSNGARDLLAKTGVLPYYYHNKGAQAGGLAFFLLPGVKQDELWRTDGTPAGTFPLTTARPMSATNLLFGAFAGKVMFIGSDGVHGYEPWITDGTNEGTRMLANLSPEGTIRGVVTEAVTGKPLAGTEVELFENGWSLGSTLTGEDGRYVLEGVVGTRLTLQARSAATHFVQMNARSFKLAPEEEATIDFSLVPGAAIRGRVTTESGHALAGLTVKLSTSLTEGPAFTAVTAADGTYLLNRLPAGTPWIAHVSVPPSGFAASSPPAFVTLGAGKTQTFDFKLKAWGRISIRIFDALTQAPAGVGEKVTFSRTIAPTTPPRDVQSVVAADGTASAVLPEDIYSVLANLADYVLASPAALVAVRPETTTTLELQVQPRGGRITGRVTEVGSNRAAPGVSVWIQRSGGDRTVHYTSSGADGAFTTRPILPPGDYTVKTHASNGFLPIDLRGVRVGPREIVTDVSLQVERAAVVRGLTTDAATGGTVGLVNVQQLPLGSGGSSTSISGTYTVNSIAPGAAHFTARKVGWKPLEFSLTLAPGEERSLDLQLEAACRITITPWRAVVPAAGGRVTFRTSAPESCKYELSAPVAGLGWARPSFWSATGSAEIEVLVSPNASRAPREAPIVVPGALFLLEQLGRD